MQKFSMYTQQEHMSWPGNSRPPTCNSIDSIVPLDPHRAEVPLVWVAKWSWVEARGTPLEHRLLLVSWPTSSQAGELREEELRACHLQYSHNVHTTIFDKSLCYTQLWNLRYVISNCSSAFGMYRIHYINIT